MYSKKFTKVEIKKSTVELVSDSLYGILYRLSNYSLNSIFVHGNYYGRVATVAPCSTRKIENKKFADLLQKCQINYYGETCKAIFNSEVRSYNFLILVDMW